MFLRASSIWVVAFAWGFVSPAAWAQADHRAHGVAAARPAQGADTAMGEGVVKKIDKAKGRVTLAHGALPNGMPTMTMAYRVKNSAWLDTLKAGQKIRFATDPADADMTVVRIEPVQ